MANVLRLPQLTRLISSKPCSKLDPSPGFRHFRHVGFGCVWRDQARNVCLMARSSVNIVGGRDSSGGHRRFGTMASNSGLKMLAVWAFAMALFVQGSLGEIACENLDKDACSFAVASSGKRLVLEKHVKRSGEEAYSCGTSEIEADKLKNWVETDQCIKACGLDRKSLGISSDSLLDSSFTQKLCSPQCYDSCPNIVDLYFNLAAREEMTSGNGEIGEPKLQDSHSKHKNLENVKSEFLENQLKEIQDQLRDNTNEIKKLKETAQGSWDLLRKIFFPVKPSVQKATMDFIAILLNAKEHKELERNEQDVHNENLNAPTAKPCEKLLTSNAQEHQELECSEHDENPLSGNDHPKERTALHVTRDKRTTQKPY